MRVFLTNYLALNYSSANVQMTDISEIELFMKLDSSSSYMKKCFR